MLVRICSRLALTGSMLIAGCAADGVQPGGPPTSVTRVARGGFQSPTDAVASPDGQTFYFTARTDAGLPAVFRVAAQPGSQATAMVTGAPLTAPTGLVLSCDGATLYVADGGGAPILALATGGGPLLDIGVTGVGTVAGLAMGPDCATLYATGRTTDDRPALFKVNRAGGAAQAVFAGAPLIAANGVFVDANVTAWVMDQSTAGAVSGGVLFSVAADGSAPKVVVNNLNMKGMVGGVSLNSAGGTAVIGTRAPAGGGQLTTIELATGKRTEVPAPELLSPAGLRTARAAPVFAVVDAEGNAIFRAD